MVGEAQVAAVLDVFWSLTPVTGTLTVPILAFLIEGGPEPILVDTGMRSPQRAMEIHRLGPHRETPEWTLEAQLANHDLGLGDIGTVILTHMHYDHAGGCQKLPNARFVLQRRELEAAAAPIGPQHLEIGGREMFFDRKDVAAMVDELWDRVELIEGDRQLFSGINCVLYEDSHTPGSQCVYVDTDDGVVGMVGDMVRKVDLNIEQGIPPGIFYDLEAMLRAMADIRERADLVYPGHDPAIAPVELDPPPSR
jgi:glyoxylase-like metal-dependent hydrolase (beta-lactamase superfamily II)